jgi:hypothetical protein
MVGAAGTGCWGKWGIVFSVRAKRLFLVYQSLGGGPAKHLKQKKRSVFARKQHQEKEARGGKFTSLGSRGRKGKSAVRALVIIE